MPGSPDVLHLNVVESGQVQDGHLVVCDLQTGNLVGLNIGHDMHLDPTLPEDLAHPESLPGEP